jgi:hypothetical protein
LHDVHALAVDQARERAYRGEHLGQGRSRAHVEVENGNAGGRDLAPDVADLA